MASPLPSNAHTKEQSNLTIALAIDWISSSYHVALWKGISDYATQHNVNLIVFPGREINSPYYYEAQANIIYDLISKKYIDGIVLTGDSIADHIDDEALLAFCQRYEPIPMVSIAKKIADMPCVLVENAVGMRNMMLHLVKDHQFRKMAFIRGPKDNSDAQQRFQIYKDVLAEYEIPFDATLVAQGNYLIEGGIIAMQALLERNDTLPEVIIACDDSTAMGAISVLTKHGIRVPDDVAIVGFDDEPGSQHVLPPLTTVQQPFYDQGYQAAEMLVARIKKQTIPTVVKLPSKLLVRQSCGCHSNVVTQAVVQLEPQYQHAPQSTDLKDCVFQLEQQKAVILPKMIEAIRTTDVSLPALGETLFDAFIKELATPAPGLFIRTLNDVLYRAITFSGDLPSWQYAISVLRNWVLYTTNNSDVLLVTENIWHQARVLIGELAQRKQAYRRTQAMQQMQLLREVSEGMIATFDMDLMLKGLAEHLPRLGINRGYVTLYEDVDAFVWGRLVLGFDPDQVEALPKHGLRYALDELIPSPYFSFDERFHLIALPLFFKSNQLGFALFSVVEPDELIYDTLRGQLSSAIQGALLMNQVQHYAKNLELEVERQTDDMREANRKLQNYAVELEDANAKLEQRNQDLREFAHISSHDLQEPLRKIQLFSTLVETKYHEVLGSAGQYYLQRIAGTAGQIQTMIHDLFAFTQVTFENQSFSQVNLTDIVETVTRDLFPLTEDTNGRVLWDELPIIEAVPMLMYQLFHHLLSNGLKFHRNDVSPEIYITSVVRQNGDIAQDELPYCEILVTDNGIGFDERYGERIFFVFRRLHDRSKYEGSGVGLAVCRKIVEQHNGRISATSKKGKGSTFTVRLPLKQP